MESSNKFSRIPVRSSFVEKMKLFFENNEHNLQKYSENKSTKIYRHEDGNISKDYAASTSSRRNASGSGKSNTISEEYGKWNKQCDRHSNREHHLYEIDASTYTNEIGARNGQRYQQTRLNEWDDKPRVSGREFMDGDVSFADSKNRNQTKDAEQIVAPQSLVRTPIPKPRNRMRNISPISNGPKSELAEETVGLLPESQSRDIGINNSHLYYGFQLTIKVNSWGDGPKVRISHEPPIPKPRLRIRNTHTNINDSKSGCDEKSPVDLFLEPNSNSIQEKKPSTSNKQVTLNEKSPDESQDEEEYIKSLLEQIDGEIDQMKRDGFIDENEDSVYVGLTDNSTFSKNENRYSAISASSSSHRTTKYVSIASTESCAREDFDEGIGMDESSNYNDKGRVDESKDIETLNKEPPPVSCNSSVPVSSKRLSYIMDEFKSTERKYVDDLTKIVRDFIPYISLHPVELLEVQEIDDLFACLKDILRHHMKFLREIEVFQDIGSIVETLISNKSLLTLYPIYFRNKPKTDEYLSKFSHIFKDMQKKFKDLFDFPTYLLIPIQRLGRYILFLKNIEKEQKKLDIPNDRTDIALDLVKSEMCKGNTFVALGSIKNNPLGECYQNYGSFIIREKFDKSKYMVFLFEKVVIFTTVDQNHSETFHYYHSIQMDHLKMAACFNNFTIFLTDITSCTKPLRKSVYVLDAKTERTWMEWRDNLSLYLTKKILLEIDEMENADFLRTHPTRKSKRSAKLVSFISYFKREECFDSVISPPREFKKIELTNESVSPHVSIQECPFDVTGYGSLIMKDKFQLKLSMPKKKRKNAVVFMFERIIVFTKEEEKDQFYFLGSINIADLTLDPTASSKPTKLLLIDFKKTKMTNSNVEYQLKAKNEEVASRWRRAIEKCLWKELIEERDNTLARFGSSQEGPEYEAPLPQL